MVTCDIVCLKKILPRQGGAPTHSCLFCNCKTDSDVRPVLTTTALAVERGTLFTDEGLAGKSREWNALWKLGHSHLTAAEFELTLTSKSWSQRNESFAGLYALSRVSISQ